VNRNRRKQDGAAVAGRGEMMGCQRDYEVRLLGSGLIFVNVNVVPCRAVLSRPRPNPLYYDSRQRGPPLLFIMSLSRTRQPLRARPHPSG